MYCARQTGQEDSERVQNATIGRQWDTSNESLQGSLRRWLLSVSGLLLSVVTTPVRLSLLSSIRGVCILILRCPLLLPLLRLGLRRIRRTGLSGTSSRCAGRLLSRRSLPGESGITVAKLRVLVRLWHSVHRHVTVGGYTWCRTYCRGSCTTFRTSILAP